MRHEPTVSHGRVSLISVQNTLLCPLPSELTDTDVRILREEVGRILRDRAVGGVVIDVSAVEAVDSYITRCIRDVAIGARLMGAITIVCGVRVDVADTLVEMGIPFEGVRTAQSLDQALAAIAASSEVAPRRAGTRR